MAEPKAKTHLQKLGFLDTDKKNSKHDIIQIWAYENAHQIIAETIMSKNEFPFKIDKIKWEHQVINQNGSFSQLVGFIDIMVKISGKFYSEPNKDFQEETREIFIEVKTEIPSVGALIRQIRAYQTYKSYVHYIVVAPDNKFEKLLDEQGIWFFKYSDPNLLF
jgi:hypothetical protein